MLKFFPAPSSLIDENDNRLVDAILSMIKQSKTKENISSWHQLINSDSFLNAMQVSNKDELHRKMTNTNIANDIFSCSGEKILDYNTLTSLHEEKLNIIAFDFPQKVLAETRALQCRYIQRQAICTYFSDTQIIISPQKFIIKYLYTCNEPTTKDMAELLEKRDKDIDPNVILVYVDNMEVINRYYASIPSFYPCSLLFVTHNEKLSQKMDNIITFTKENTDKHFEKATERDVYYVQYDHPEFRLVFHKLAEIAKTKEAMKLKLLGLANISEITIGMKM